MQNILDLAFANDDSVATKLEVTAVISDQDMVLFDLLVHALKGKGCRSGKYIYALKHTYHVRGMASTLRMRTTISPGQWQP